MNDNNLDFDNIEDIFPLSDIQMGMIYESLITGTPSFYYNQSIIPFKDKNFDFDRFKRAVSLLVDKHPMLRTGFNLTDPEELVQVVYKKVPLDIEYYDLCQKKPAEQESYIKSCLLREKEKFFDISGSEPFWRIRIFQIDRENIYFTWINHHAIHDGWSLASFMTDLNNTYLALYNDPHFVPEKLKSSYKNFIIDQIIEKKNVKTIEFWKNELKDYKRFEIPGKVPEYIEKNKKRWISKDLGMQTLEKLMGIAQKYNVSPRHICFAAYAYTLYMVSYGNDFLVGMVIHNRPECEDGDKIIGCFLNEMPVRIKIPAQLTWIEYIYLIDRKLIELTDFNKLSLFEIARIIGEKKPGSNPFFDTIFNYTDFHIYNHLDRSLLREMETLSPININSLSENTQFETNTPLDFRVDISGTLLLNVSFFDSVLTQEMGEKLCLYFINVINCFINEIGGMAKKEAIMGIAEKAKLLYEFNNTAVNFPREKSIAQLFAEQAAQTPDAVALVAQETAETREKHITYFQLNEQSNRLAGSLIEKGVLPDTIVGLMIERSVEMVIGIFGILKAGGAYLPIDPQFPEERINYMLKDSSAKIMINSLEGCPRRGLSCFDIRDSNFNSSNLAYIIYTSGSTGKPKGVAIQHRSVINFIKGITDIIPITSNDRILSLTTISFDIFGLETLVPLICGSVVIMGSREEQLNPEAAALVLERELISIFQVTPSKLQMLISFPGTAKVLNILKYLLVGGEIFPDSLLTKVKTLISGKIFNMYGPTETTIWSTVKEVNIEKLEGLNIGKPIANTWIYILDHSYMLVPIGVTGELFIGGDGVARGYLNRPELTAEKFDQDLWNKKDDQDEKSKSFSGVQGAIFQKSPLVYRTGDLARWLPDGNIEFQGRIDQQVKIRGFRIELGEIENCLLKYPGIKEAVLMVPEKESGEKYLCAYIVAIRDLIIAELREYLANELPDYMIPSHFMQIEKIPLTSNGKVDRQALDLYSKQLDTGKTYVAPENDTQEKIIEIWQKVLKINKIGINDNYFDLGGTSFDIIRINKNLRDTFQVEIPIPVMFRFTTVHSLENFLNNKIREISDQSEDLRIERSSNFKKEEKRTTEIAVIGMSGKFPGAKDLVEFWHNVKNGKETISFFSAKELQENAVPDNLLNNPNYVKAAGILEDIEYFDASFFGYTPKEAEIMDPQFRIFHECVWNALEDAGYNSNEYKGLIGLYAGASSNIDWQARIFMSGKNRDIGLWAANHLFDKSFLTLKISYKFNLRGPSFELNTACSTSLVAIHTGCKAILNGECDMALAGAVSIAHLEKSGYLYEEGMIFSPDGHCRVFDARANGTIPSEGAGVVVLKHLDDAILDKDHIYAVIKGTAINNDGINKAGFTAPSVEGQALAIRMALEMAGVTPGSINYIETHGTGTKLGDPVEIEALKLAFNTDKKSFCAVGSIKSNIGHTDNAAGIAGFLKTILAITHKCIPSTLNFEIPNPNIDFINSPFYINSVLTEWERGEYPRRAGVSAFGIGGTNAHVILEEWAIEKEKKRKNLDYKLFLLSARTEPALNIIRKNLADYLKNNPDVNLEDIVYTLQMGRRFYNYRWMAICSTYEEAVNALTSNKAGEAHAITWEEEKRNAIKIEFNDGKERLLEIGRLWLHGHKIDFKAFYPGSDQFRVPLPTYPFEKQKYWLNPVNFNYILQNEKPGDYVMDKTDQLETFNINDTGKEKELFPLHPRPNLANEYVLPRNSTEKAIAVIWQRLFGFEAIGVKDDFLELGGNSLNAITVISHIYEELGVNIPVTEFFRRTTIEQMADYIQDNKKETNYTNIEPVEKKEYYLLSSGQLRIYILHQLNMESKSYNIPFCFTIKGNLDISQLEYSFKKIIKQHESFRTAFLMVPQGPAQVIHDDVNFVVEYFEGNENEIPGILANFVRPFDLKNPPLLRIRIVKFDQMQHLLMLDMFHIIADGFSIDILIKNFISAYKGNDLTPLKIQYKDYAEWQRHSKQAEYFLRQKEFWEKEFAEEISLLDLPIDYTRPSLQTFEGNTIGFEITKKTVAELKVVMVEKSATLYMMLFALYNIFLAKLSGRDDIIIGTPAAGRRHSDLEKIIGMFVNTLPLRNYPSGKKKFTYFLEEVREKILNALENQDYQYEEIVEQLLISRDSGRNPLFDTMFVFQNIKIEPIEIPGLVLIPYENKNKTSKFDLTLTIEEIEQKLLLRFEYNTKLFKDETIYRFSSYFKNIVESIVENKNQRIIDLEILTTEEKNRLLFEFNNTEVEYPKDKTIHQLFFEQALKTPDHIVLVGSVEGEEKKRRREEEKDGGVETLRATSLHITYLQLNEQSDHLAGLLIEKAVQTGDIVGMMAERSFEMIIGLLGILKSGAAYLPLNPGQPEARTLFMMKDSGAKILIKKSNAQMTKHGTNSNNQNKNQHFGVALVLNFEHLNLNFLKGCPRRGLSGFEFRISDLNPSNPAYIIYTSGSTGNPKGVIVEHRSVINLVYGLKKKIYGYDNPFSVALISPIYFDASVKQIFPTLALGHRLVIASENDLISGEQLLHLYTKYNITVSDGTPGHLILLLDNLSKFKLPYKIPVKRFVIGGDILNPSLIRKLMEFIDSDNARNELEIVNVYGPTECCDVTAIFTVTRDNMCDFQRIPIGTPLDNIRVFIIGKGETLQPRGVAGELCISGACLGRGYLNHPELTAAKYKPFSRFFKKAPLAYRTGDLARWIPDPAAPGDYVIEFLGRIDHQVKIRGFRIELGEIENCLLKHPGIKEAVLAARDEEEFGGKYLCAYIISDREYEVAGLREFLLKELPDYMIPSYFVFLEKIPLTPNGKVDRKALPKPNLKVGQDYVAPRNEMESKLVECWADVLNIQPDVIGIDQNFFELGGHSLKATILVSRIHKELKVKIPLAEFFKNSTIRGLSEYIGEKPEEIYESIMPVEEKDYYDLSFAQKRMYILQHIDLNSTAYNMPEIIPLTEEVDISRLEESFKKLLKRHDSLRTSFHMIGDQPGQKVHNEVEFEIKIFGRGDPAWSPEIITNFVRPFDLSHAPLLRVGLVSSESEKHFLLVDMHHIISDGVSHEILVKDFLALHEGKELLPLRIQYKDFAQWQNSQKEVHKIRRQMEYWLEEFAGEIPLLEIPIDYPRPINQSFAGNNILFEISTEDTQTLKNLALQQGATLFMILTAVVNILLSKLSGQEEIIVGTPIAGRRHADLEKIIGMFVNTLALRNFPVGDQTIKEFLADIKRRVLMAFENQEYPFEELVDKLALKRDMGRNPLFDVMFVLQNINSISTGMEEETPLSTLFPLQSDLPEEYENITQTAKFDLTFYAVETRRNTIFNIQYCTKLFKKETVQRFSYYFKKILAQIIENPGLKLKEIEITLDEERQQLLFEFNNTENVYANNKTIHGLFAEQAAQTPDAIALVARETREKHEKNGNNVETLRATSLQYQYQCQITYCQLNEQSNRLAGLLIDKGVQTGDIIGIMAERSFEMIIGLLGILKSGAAYLPLNPGQPQARTQYMLKDSNTRILITNKEKKKTDNCQCSIVNCQLPMSEPRASLQHSAFIAQHSNHLAYIIYTSGSTGNPKGAAISHANLSPLMHWGYLSMAISGKDRFLQNLSYFFDWSAWEIFLALTTGARLNLANEDILLDGYRLGKFITKHEITVLHITPSQFQVLVGIEIDEKPLKLQSLRHLCLGAEKLTYDLLKRSLEIVPKDCRIYNMYGPTEATIISSVLEINRNTLDIYQKHSSIPIGVPVGNTRLYVLNKYFNLCPRNVTGELFIGGEGLSRGYLNNPELTAERFLKTSSSYGSYRTNILYKTGDLACWLADGVIEFFGRIDHQVKIRGYRIELGEIENKLLAHKRVKAAVAIVRKETELGAFVVPEEPGADEIELKKELKEYLTDRLPGYMVPSFIALINKIPLTPNGKVDLHALPQPETELIKEYIAPRNGLEEKLATIWSAILGISKDIIGIDAGFFEMGGHSLKATVLASRVHKELNVILPLAELFKAPTIRGLSEYIWNAQEEIYQSIMPVEEKEYYDLSFAQKRMYILQQIDLTGTAYNMPEIMPLTKNVDFERLEESFKKLIKRHESLRTSFHMIGDQPVQKVHQEVDFKIEYLATDEHGQTRTFFVRAFDLSKAPLLRVGLLKPEAEKYLLMVDMHHIISDGVSHQILREDFMALYLGKELSPLRLQYKDFAQWQNSPKEIERLNQQILYWLKEFEGEIPVLEIPIDYPRPISQSFAGNNIDFEISTEETRALKNLALQQEATLFMILAAVVNILLSKLSGQEEIIIGTPIAGRRHADLEKIIGMFVNTLALRNYTWAEQTFSEFLEAVKARVLPAFENQEYPFEELVNKLSLQRDVGRNPLFDVMFSLQNINPVSVDSNHNDEHRLEMFGFQDENKNIGQTAKFDLTFTVLEVGEKILFSIQYCTKLFKKETIEQFIVYLKNIINAVIKNKARRISNFEIITEEEKKRILVDFNNIGAEYPKDKTIHGLFVEQALKTPDHVSLVGAGRGEEKRRRREEEKRDGMHLSYYELNEQSDRLAGLLIEKGVLPDTIVAIMMEWSVDLIIGILGILKSGGAYLPINAKNPQERINYTLKDSKAKLLIINKSEIRNSKFETNPNKTNSNDPNKNRNPGAALVLNFENLNLNFIKGCPRRGLQHSIFHAFDVQRAQHSNHLAYIIYTSGSTGNPKGVPICHANICPLLHWGYRNLGIGCGERSLQNLSYYFDWSVWEIFITLTTGANLYIVSDEVLLNPAGCINFMKEKDITILHVTPTQYQHIISGDQKIETLKYLFLGAELLTVDLLRRSFSSVQEECRVFNMYGPTEATIISAVLEIKRGDESRFENLSGVPIGGPVANGSLLVLDKYLHLSPVNVTGELYIVGDGLAAGYLNNPELTAKKFDQDLWDEKDDQDENGALRALNGCPRRGLQHSKYYRTGDLCKWLTDGNIEFLGRIDHQVKIRGFRIELGEIENQLLKHKHIKEAVVVINEDAINDKNLTAYIIPSGELLEIELREYLKGKLPEYMIPSRFVQIEKIPLTPNGKIDRKALPKPELTPGESYVAPRNDMEMKLVELWSELLNIQPGAISIDRSFFELGGHSLKATVLASRIHKEFDVILPLAEIFKAPTIKDIGKYIENAKSTIYKNIDWNVVLLKESLSGDNHFFFIHDGSGEVEGYIEFCKHLTRDFNYWGIRANRLENLAPRNVTIQQLAKKYINSMKKIQSHGPYYIAGWSLGGTIAFEMVAQLEQTNDKIVFLALIDSPPPHKSLGAEACEFNFESELNLIKEYSQTAELRENVKNTKELDRLWTSLVDYLEASDYDVEIIKKTIAEFGVQALPNFHQLGIKESIYYLNLGRTLRNARALYKPSMKNQTPVYYFAASESKQIPKKCWNDYCQEPVTFYEINGDHFSILKMPIVTEFAKRFTAILRSGLDISSIE